jgi:hypothetical protein
VVVYTKFHNLKIAAVTHFLGEITIASMDQFGTLWQLEIPKISTGMSMITTSNVSMEVGTSTSLSLQSTPGGGAAMAEATQAKVKLWKQHWQQTLTKGMCCVLLKCVEYSHRTSENPAVCSRPSSSLIKTNSNHTTRCRNRISHRNLFANMGPISLTSEDVSVQAVGDADATLSTAASAAAAAAKAVRPSPAIDTQCTGALAHPSAATVDASLCERYLTESLQTSADRDNDAAVWEVEPVLPISAPPPTSSRTSSSSNSKNGKLRRRPPYPKERYAFSSSSSSSATGGNNGNKTKLPDFDDIDRGGGTPIAEASIPAKSAFTRFGSLDEEFQSTVRQETMLVRFWSRYVPMLI